MKTILTVTSTYENHVCVCVWSASVSVCNWFYNLIHMPQKQILVFFVWKFGFGPGEVMEKSWNFFFLFFFGNPAIVIISVKGTRTLQYKINSTTIAPVTSHSRAPCRLFPGCSRAVLNKNRTSTHGASAGPVRRRTNFALPYGPVEF